MAALPTSWTLHKEGQLIHDNMVLCKGIAMSLGQLNALLTTNFIGARGPAADPSTGSQYYAW